MAFEDETLRKMAAGAEAQEYTVEDILRYAILTERARCVEIASLPKMTPKDILRAIKKGDWINPGNG
jgi:hypothetical protein